MRRGIARKNQHVKLVRLLITVIIMARKRNNQPKSVASIFNKLLPPDYAKKRAELDQLQQFFTAQESDAVFAMVSVVNITEQYLHVSLPNATLSAYLRLHSAQISQTLRENFNIDVELKISTRPEAPEQQAVPKLKARADFTDESRLKMQRSAQYIEDDELKAALNSLSETLLKQKNKND